MDVGKKVHSCMAVELQIITDPLESSIEIPQNTWNGPTFDPAILHLGLYLKEFTLAHYSNAATSIFIAAQFTIARL